jgi:hypothetical protein
LFLTAGKGGAVFGSFVDFLIRDFPISAPSRISILLYLRHCGIIAAVQATITDRYHKIKRKSGQGPDRGTHIYERDNPLLSQITMYLGLPLLFVFHILSASAQCQWATIANLNAGCLILGLLSFDIM